MRDLRFLTAFEMGKRHIARLVNGDTVSDVGQEQVGANGWNDWNILNGLNFSKPMKGMPWQKI